MNYQNISKNIHITINNIKQDVPLDILLEFGLITDQLDYFQELNERNSKIHNSVTEPPEEHSIPISLNENDLNLVVDYTKRIFKIEKETNKDNKIKLIDECNFLITQLSKNDLDSLLYATEYMNCEKLLDRICDGIVTDIRYKTPLEINEKYNLANDLTDKQIKDIWTAYRDYL